MELDHNKIFKKNSIVILSDTSLMFEISDLRIIDSWVSNNLIKGMNNKFKINYQISQQNGKNYITFQHNIEKKNDIYLFCFCLGQMSY